MSEILLPFPDDLKGDGLVAYLNEHIDKLRQALDLDVSWAYIRAVIDDVRVTAASRNGLAVRIAYEYDYSAHCSCKNLDARDTFAGNVTCEVRNGNIVLPEFEPPERSTLDEF